jgi:hypothetical protein
MVYLAGSKLTVADLDAFRAMLGSVQPTFTKVTLLTIAPGEQTAAAYTLDGFITTERHAFPPIP